MSGITTTRCRASPYSCAAVWSRPASSSIPTDFLRAPRPLSAPPSALVCSYRNPPSFHHGRSAHRFLPPCAGSTLSPSSASLPLGVVPGCRRPEPESPRRWWEHQLARRPKPALDPASHSAWSWAHRLQSCRLLSSGKLVTPTSSNSDRCDAAGAARSPLRGRPGLFVMLHFFAC
jgi:hypothetical protein